jgi:hypothetical protein
LDLVVRDERLAVCRLPATSAAPPWASGSGIVSLTWTGDELSIIASESTVPADVQCVRGWRPLMVVGPLDFGLTGILASIAEPLANAGVSIFALSTFDTDYVLVPEGELTVALGALTAFGHRITMSEDGMS